MRYRTECVSNKCCRFHCRVEDNGAGVHSADCIVLIAGCGVACWCRGHETAAAQHHGCLASAAMASSRVAVLCGKQENPFNRCLITPPADPTRRAPARPALAIGCTPSPSIRSGPASARVKHGLASHSFASACSSACSPAHDQLLGTHSKPI